VKQISFDSDDELIFDKDKDLFPSKRTKTDYYDQDNQQITLFKPSNQQSNNLIINNLNKIKSISSDIHKIQQTIGIFKMFNKIKLNNQYQIIKPEIFIEKLENLLMDNYGQTDPIVDHFFCLIDEDFYEWYFNLNDQTKANFSTFKKSFLEKTKEVEFNSFNKATMQMGQLVNCLADDKSIMEEVKTKPISTFLLQKYKLLKMLFPN
jgi:hypothetical protein